MTVTSTVTSTVTPAPPEALLELLGRLACALERNEPAAAGVASDRLTELLASYATAGIQLGPATLAAAQALYRRCQDGAVRSVASLRASLVQSAQQRRAADSYAAGGSDSGGNGNGRSGA
jgi:hypothetical protein